MHRLLLTFFTCIIILYSHAQDKINYTQIRKSTIHYSCTENNIDSINLTLNQLLKIESTNISSGKDEYYYDIGLIYYIKSIIEKKPELLTASIKNFNNAILINPKNGSSYLNLSLVYYFQKKFSLANENLKKYKKYTKKKYWDRSTIKVIENSN